MCTCDDWYIVVKKVNVQCSIVITSFIEKFAQKLLNQEFMNIIKIIYPQHSWNFNVKNTFLNQLAWSFSLSNDIVLRKSLIMKAWKYLLYWMNKSLTWELPFLRSICKQIVDMLWSFLWHEIPRPRCGPICPLLMLCYNNNF
jgi:hypothetical protein